MITKEQAMKLRVFRHIGTGAECFSSGQCRTYKRDPEAFLIRIYTPYGFQIAGAITLDNAHEWEPTDPPRYKEDPSTFVRRTPYQEEVYKVVTEILGGKASYHDKGSKEQIWPGMGLPISWNFSGLGLHARLDEFNEKVFPKFPGTRIVPVQQGSYRYAPYRIYCPPTWGGVMPKMTQGQQRVHEIVDRYVLPKDGKHLSQQKLLFNLNGDVIWIIPFHYQIKKGEMNLTGLHDLLVENDAEILENRPPDQKWGPRLVAKLSQNL